MKFKSKFIVLISMMLGFLFGEVLVDVDHLHIFPYYIFHWLGTVFFLTFFGIGLFIFTKGERT